MHDLVVSPAMGVSTLEPARCVWCGRENSSAVNGGNRCESTGVCRRGFVSRIDSLTHSLGRCHWFETHLSVHLLSAGTQTGCISALFLERRGRTGITSQRERKHVIRKSHLVSEFDCFIHLFNKNDHRMITQSFLPNGRRDSNPRSQCMALTSLPNLITAAPTSPS